MLPIALGKSPVSVGGGDEGEGKGAMGACLIDGVRSDTVLVWAAVSIGVAKGKRERLQGRLDGRWESGILWLFMVHMFSNSSTWLVSGAT